VRFPKIIVLAGALFLASCQEKDFDLANPENSFAIAKKPYVQGNYEIALNKLGEFKTRFPYSRFAIDAELLIANAYFELGRYGEAVVSYEQFIKLHPKHEQVAFAQFRIGQSYWQQAPKDKDREQDLSSKAIAAFDKLAATYPDSEYAAEAQELSKQGQRRLAESQEFVAGYYCRQEIWHACAHRYLALAESYNKTFPDLVKKALNQAAVALDKLAERKGEVKDNEDESNLYLKAMSREELKQRAGELRDQAQKL
jgi:outer membrane protein assembly factor BamD